MNVQQKITDLLKLQQDQMINLIKNVSDDLKEKLKVDDKWIYIPINVYDTFEDYEGNEIRQWDIKKIHIIDNELNKTIETIRFYDSTDNDPWWFNSKAQKIKKIDDEFDITFDYKILPDFLQ